MRKSACLPARPEVRIDQQSTAASEQVRKRKICGETNVHMVDMR